MKNLVIKIILVTVLISINRIAFCQQSTDGEFLFKMWFFIEHVNNHSRTEKDFPVKDSALFSLFDSVVDLKLDTLKSKGFDSIIVF
jgi:hypothetical protein